MRTSIQRFTLLTAASTLLLLALSLSGCGGPAAAASADQPTPVHVVPVTRADLTRELVYVADLQADAAVKVYSPVTDRIEQLAVTDGDEVRAGDVLAVVRADSLDMGLSQIAAQLDGLQAQAAQAEAELARSQDLYGRGVITEQARDQAATAAQSARSQLRATQASFDQLAITAGDATVTAPIDGVIANAALKRGDMASPQAPLCTVMDLDPIRLQLHLAEADLPHVRVGQTATLRVDAVPDRAFTGTVVTILPYLDPATRTNTVEVEVANPRDAAGLRPLKPGMFGRATVEVERRDQALAAPEHALVMDSALLAAQQPGQQLRRAFVIDDQDIARQRVVELGLADDGRVEILDGLAEGDRLVTRGQHQLLDGEAVEVVVAPEEVSP
jgi:RND family efflux transporter MFP subunit